MRTFEREDLITCLNSCESQFENLKDLGVSLGLIFEIENNKILDIINYNLPDLRNVIYRSFLRYSDDMYMDKTYVNRILTSRKEAIIDINLTKKANRAIKCFDVFHIVTTKSFNELKKKLNKSSNQEIDVFCQRYKIYDYVINDDSSIDVYGDVYLENKRFVQLPIKFGKVTGNFNCNFNNLESLEGCPNYVGGDFYCTYNNLLTLENSPSEVIGRFDCSNNKLESLKGSPNFTGGHFICSNNNLKSLKHGPTKVLGFACSYNKLVTLEYSPKEVSDDFHCQFNKLTSLEGITEKLTGLFICNHNEITSLRGLSEEIRNICCYENPISKFWDMINDINKLEVFLYMDIDTNDPEEITQQKIDYILHNS